jgi:hypothetical protein
MLRLEATSACICCCKAWHFAANSCREVVGELPARPFLGGERMAGWWYTYTSEKYERQLGL